MHRILGLGDNTVDTYVDAGVQYPGGNAVNVAVMTARMGAETGYLGCVGEDEGGALVRSALVAEGWTWRGCVPAPVPTPAPSSAMSMATGSSCAPKMACARTIAGTMRISSTSPASIMCIPASTVSSMTCYR